MTPRTQSLYAFVGGHNSLHRPASADKAMGQGIAAINRAVARVATGTQSWASDNTVLLPPSSHGAAPARSTGGAVSGPLSASDGAEECPAPASAQAGCRAQASEEEGWAAEGLLLQGFNPAPAHAPPPKVSASLILKPVQLFLLWCEHM